MHIFLDAFNNYGVGWFEPFSHYRISFNIIYIADPLFSIWPGIACLALIVMRSKREERKKWWIMGLSLSGLYLVYCLGHKIKIDNDVRDILEAKKITYTRYFTTPAPFQNWLWYVVAGDDNGYHVGYRSVFDRKKEMDFTFFPRNDSLLIATLDHESLHKLIRFSQQFYTIEKWENTLVFNDLRFGQMMGWKDPQGRFVFHYFLQEPLENLLVVQRGRFKGWSFESVDSMWQRIKGNR